MFKILKIHKNYVLQDLRRYTTSGGGWAILSNFPPYEEHLCVSPVNVEEEVLLITGGLL